MTALRESGAILATLKDWVKSISWRDRGRAASQWLQLTPAFGLILLANWKQRRIAGRDAGLTVLFGAIGVWLPLALHYGIDTQPTFTQNLHNVADRGEVFILVPSLVAPLLLLMAALRQNTRMRRHQVGLISYSLFASALALIFWARSSHGQSVDFWLAIWTLGAFVTSFVLLHVYFLSINLSDSVLEQVKGTSKSLTAAAVSLREREGK
jgi:hypothetical protein